MDTSVAVTITRPDITERLPEREMTRPYVPQMASMETFAILKEEFVELALGWSSLTTCMLVTKITDEFILGLDVLRDHDPSSALGCCMLRLSGEELSW